MTSNNIISFRRHDLDNIKTFLSGLVVVHHTTIPYGGSPSSYIRSAIVHGPSPALLAFKSVNQSFFMGMFFWMSGRMTAQSLAKSPPGGFLRDKIIRLGVPTVFYTLFIIPAVQIVALRSWDVKTIQDTVLGYWCSLGGVTGNSWYTATLLVFDSFAALLAWQQSRSSLVKPSPSSNSRDSLQSSLYRLTSFAAFENWGWLAVALAGFLIRTRSPGFPMGRAWAPLNLHLSFLPQYVYAYTLGYQSIATGRSRIHGPFDKTTFDRDAEKIKDQTTPIHQPTAAGLSLPVSILTSVATLSSVVVPTVLVHGFSDLAPRVLSQISGGWNASALLYSVWNEFSFVTISPALMAYFQQRFNEPINSWWWRPRYSYATFLIHNLVSMGVAVWAESLFRHLLASSSWARSCFSSATWNALGPSVLTAVVGSVQVFSSFVVGKGLVEYVPGLKRII